VTGENHQLLNKYFSFLRRILPVLALAIPIAILYVGDPASFDSTWKGRTFYLFFMWLIILETIMSWREPKPIQGRLKPLKIGALAVALILPSLYVVDARAYGVNDAIGVVSINAGIPLWGLMWLAVEYLVLTLLFVLITSLNYGVKGMSDFSMSSLFLGAIGMIYVIDNLYPNGNFMPFQMIVPTTARFASNVLNTMGYNTTLSASSSMPLLRVWNSSGAYAMASIAWPCSGVESLIIYSITILLFLRRSDAPIWLKAIYFSIGAGVTYFINILRIATIFVIGVDNSIKTAYGAFTNGISSSAASTFHNYYGQLYSVTWIISYPLLIIGIQLLLNKIKAARLDRLPNLTKAQPTTG
jgi:thaumarchaeosortase